MRPLALVREPNALYWRVPERPDTLAWLNLRAEASCEAAQLADYIKESKYAPAYVNDMVRALRRGKLFAQAQQSRGRLRDELGDQLVQCVLPLLEKPFALGLARFQG